MANSNIGRYLPPKIPSACSSIFSKSSAAVQVKRQTHSYLTLKDDKIMQCHCLKRGFKETRQTWHVVGHVRVSHRCCYVRLAVGLIELTLEDAEQARDAVIQPHIQDELSRGKIAVIYSESLNLTRQSYRQSITAGSSVTQFWLCKEKNRKQC